MLALKAKQGWAPFGVEMKIVDDENRELPWDGKRFGRLKVAGFAVAQSYFKGAGGEILDENGFFDTGDVATIDPNGYMQITDRAKDVIKSGGEWISSIDIENLAVGHPDVAEAAVIGIPHPKWDERPLLIVVPKEGRTPQREDVLGFLEGRIAKWWMPDDMQTVTRNSAHRDRQDQQAEAARGVQGLSAADSVMNDRFRIAAGGVADAAAIRDLTRAAYAKWIPVIGREPMPMIADYDEAVRRHRFDLLEAGGETRRPDRDDRRSPNISSSRTSRSRRPSRARPRAPLAGACGDARRRARLTARCGYTLTSSSPRMSLSTARSAIASTARRRSAAAGASI